MNVFECKRRLSYSTHSDECDANSTILDRSECIGQLGQLFLPTSEVGISPRQLDAYRRLVHEFRTVGSMIATYGP